MHSANLVQLFPSPVSTSYSNVEWRQINADDMWNLTLDWQTDRYGESVVITPFDSQNDRYKKAFYDAL